jgi:hypothetical protein
MEGSAPTPPNAISHDAFAELDAHNCLFVMGIMLAPLMCSARDVMTIPRGTCVDTRLARITHQTNALFTNGMSMWLEGDEERLKSWHTGDHIRLCKVGGDSPWGCDADGNCINLLMIVFRIKAQNLTRHECPVTWRAEKQTPCARIMLGSDH